MYIEKWLLLYSFVFSKHPDGEISVQIITDTIYVSKM